MKKILSKYVSIFMATMISLPFAIASEPAVSKEESSVSYNVGYMSDYWYRGVYQSTSAVSFGADYENGGIYIGTWWADVDTGLEHDYYAGYGFNAMGADLYVGLTGYYYTDNFDSDYEEVNMGIAMGPLAVDHSTGTYKTATDDSYQYTSVSLDLDVIGLPLTLTAGAWGGDTLKGNVWTVDYSTTLAGADIGLQVGKNDDDITGAAKYKDTTFAVFTLGYSF
ncbi:MAG: TorF family putative porin [Gammaproteobacteria bacterium]|nr:TorF family putative porin [Gammaproteobacteria bacterium]